MQNIYSDPRTTMCKPYWQILRALACAGLATAAALAQGATGTIAGRVSSAATKEFVRNAEVRVDGTNLVAYTEDGGFFRLSGVPAGPASVTVNYTGTEPAR